MTSKPQSEPRLEFKSINDFTEAQLAEVGISAESKAVIAYIQNGDDLGTALEKAVTDKVITAEQKGALEAIMNPPAPEPEIDKVAEVVDPIDLFEARYKKDSADHKRLRDEINDLKSERNNKVPECKTKREGALAILQGRVEKISAYIAKRKEGDVANIKSAEDLQESTKTLIEKGVKIIDVGAEDLASRDLEPVIEALMEAMNNQRLLAPAEEKDASDKAALDLLYSDADERILAAWEKKIEEISSKYDPKALEDEYNKKIEAKEGAAQKIASDQLGYIKFTRDQQLKLNTEALETALENDEELSNLQGAVDTAQSAYDGGLITIGVKYSSEALQATLDRARAAVEVKGFARKSSEERASLNQALDAAEQALQEGEKAKLDAIDDLKKNTGVETAKTAVTAREAVLKKEYAGKERELNSLFDGKEGLINKKVDKYNYKVDLSSADDAGLIITNVKSSTGKKVFMTLLGIGTLFAGVAAVDHFKNDGNIRGWVLDGVTSITSLVKKNS